MSLPRCVLVLLDTCFVAFVATSVLWTLAWRPFSSLQLLLRQVKEGVNVYRFANRIPLLFEGGSDVVTKVAFKRIK